MQTPTTDLNLNLQFSTGKCFVFLEEKGIGFSSVPFCAFSVFQLQSELESELSKSTVKVNCLGLYHLPRSNDKKESIDKKKSSDKK